MKYSRRQQSSVPETYGKVYNAISPNEPRDIGEISMESGLSLKTVRYYIDIMRKQREVMQCGKRQTSGLDTPLYILGCGEDSFEYLEKKKKEIIPFRQWNDVLMFGEYRKIEQSQCAEM